MNSQIRAYQERQKQLGEVAELPADVEPFGERRAREINALNERRAKHGLPPFENDEVDNPELTRKRRQRSEAFFRGRSARSR